MRDHRMIGGEMEIQTLWVMRKGADNPEILEAWDEYEVEENPEGFREACKRALEAVGEDVETRYVTIKLGVEFYKAFEPIVVDSAVTDYRAGISGATK